jgi:hypothetical protein
MPTRSRRGTLALVLALFSCLGAAACSTGSDAVPIPSDAGAGTPGTPDGGMGGSGMSGSAPVVVCDPRPVVIDPTAIIDDMEDRNGSLTPTSGRNGSWWTTADETPGGTLEPRMPIPEAILGGRCGSQYAMRVTGQGFDDWGALLGLAFKYAPDENGEYGPAPVDAHIRQGIRFWARVGDTSTRQVLFNLGDFHAAPEGGFCVEDGSPACFNYEVTLSQIDTSWKQYTIPFAALVHATPDNPNEPIDPTTLYTLNFYFRSSEVFDFWVDDLEFY